LQTRTLSINPCLLAMTGHVLKITFAASNRKVAQADREKYKTSWKISEQNYGPISTISSLSAGSPCSTRLLTRKFNALNAVVQPVE
jgi:hypothetical protein